MIVSIAVIERYGSDFVTTFIVKYGSDFVTAAISTAATKTMAIVVQSVPYTYDSSCPTTAVAKIW